MWLNDSTANGRANVRSARPRTVPDTQTKTLSRWYATWREEEEKRKVTPM